MWWVTVRRSPRWSNWSARDISTRNCRAGCYIVGVAEGTRIRWAEHTLNAMTGCTRVSEGCDHCYAETLIERYGAPAFPDGFKPVFKPGKLADPEKWWRKSGPGRIFVNSLSDVHHPDFTPAEIDAVYDTMLNVDRHDYLVLTKRPQAMARYFNGYYDELGWLDRRGLDAVPGNIWLGTSIELDKYCALRTRALTSIPAQVHFLSLEPLLGPLPSLSLDDIQWCIVGGESGPGFRPMDVQWARDLRDQADAAGVAFFFKQSAAYRTETGIELDGQLHEEYPLEHPADRERFAHTRVIGRWTGRHSTPIPVTVQGTLL